MSFTKDGIPYDTQSNAGYAGDGRVAPVPMPHAFQPRPGYGRLCMCWRPFLSLVHTIMGVVPE